MVNCVFLPNIQRTFRENSLRKRGFALRTITVFVPCLAEDSGMINSPTSVTSVVGGMLMRDIQIWLWNLQYTRIT